MKTLKILCAVALTVSTVSHLQAHSTAMDNQTQSSQNKAVQSNKAYKEIHTKEIPAFLRANPSVVIIDVQNTKYDEGHRLPGAKHLPPETSDDEMKAFVPNRDAIILVYCVSAECPLSEYMSERFAHLGYKNVTRYVEGLEGWEAEGNPTDKAVPGKKSEGVKEAKTDSTKK